MPKGPVTKKRLSITLDSDLVDTLLQECEERTMKISNYIEKLIKLGKENEKKR